MNYLGFLAANARFITFGFVLTMLSSYGQTFYVALYGTEIRAEFELSNGGFGAVYSFVSIVAAILLVWVGRLIDRVDLRLYTAVTLIALTGAMVALSFTSSLWFLALGLFFVRFCGQGLCIHIMGTAMARYFAQDRGKALSLSGLGLASGEAVLPVTTVALIAVLGWRDVWLATGAVTALAVVILWPYMLGDFKVRQSAYLERQARTHDTKDAPRDWTRMEVLRDPRFFGAMALLLAYPYISTGVLFHQAFIAESKGWTIGMMAAGLISLAVVKVATSLVIGPLIDRRGAVRLIPATAVPFAVSFAVLSVSDHPVLPYIFLGALGMGIGMLQPVLSAMFAELYGVANLGGIRAMAVSALVLAAAAAPATFGWLFDAEVPVETVTAACTAYVLAAAVGAFAVLRRDARHRGAFGDTARPG